MIVVDRQPWQQVPPRANLELFTLGTDVVRVSLGGAAYTPTAAVIRYAQRTQITRHTVMIDNHFNPFGFTALFRNTTTAPCAGSNLGVQIVLPGENPDVRAYQNTGPAVGGPGEING